MEARIADERGARVRDQRYGEPRRDLLRDGVAPLQLVVVMEGHHLRRLYAVMVKEKL